jgi:hypothetical protein
MRRAAGFIGLVAIVVGISCTVVAESGYSGSLEFDVGLLPAIDLSESSEFTLNLGDWTFSIFSDFTFYPAIAGEGRFELWRAWDLLSLGAYLDLGYVPFGLNGIGLLGEVTLVDTEFTLGEGKGSLTLDAAVTVPLYLFLDGVNVSLDLDVTLDPWWLLSETDLDFSLSAVDFQEYLELGVTLLDLKLDEAGTTTLVGTLAAGTWFLPSPYGDLVGTLVLTSGKLALKSISTLSWAEWAFDEWIKLSYGSSSLSGWAWLEASTVDGVSAGLGFKWAFSGVFSAEATPPVK